MAYLFYFYDLLLICKAVGVSGKRCANFGLLSVTHVRTLRVAADGYQLNHVPDQWGFTTR